LLASDTRTPVEKCKETIANNKLKDLAELCKQEAGGKGLFVFQCPLCKVEICAVKRPVKQTAKAEEQQRKVKEAAGRFYSLVHHFIIITDDLLARSNIRKPSKKRVASPLLQLSKKKSKGLIPLFLDIINLSSLM